jgi:hypothetical protein
MATIAGNAKNHGFIVGCPLGRMDQAENRWYSLFAGARFAFAQLFQLFA